VTSPTEPAPVAAAPAEGDVVGRACPICQAQLVRGELAVRCPACQLDYHDECWRENGGCGAYGCARAPEAKKAAAGEAPALHWGGEKRCPACGAMIKSQALICTRCRARFWTRDTISREAWARREYEGDELAKVRNVMLLVFLASACGCLFPITALYTGLWLKTGTSGIYPVARLPPTLAMLLKASFAVSCVWAVMFVAVVAL
jgi:hypothetical protein